MAMKVYKVGKVVQIDQTAQPLLSIDEREAIYKIEGGNVTIFNNRDKTIDRTDILANVQDFAGTPIGDIQDIVKYFGSGIINRGSTTTLPTLGGPSGGEVNTASNVGAGDGVFKAKVGVDLEFKSLIGGAGVTITPGVDEITFAASGATVETFYLERIETIDNNSAVDIEYFTEVQGGTEIVNVISAVGGTYLFNINWICLNTSQGGSIVVTPQIDSVDVFSQAYEQEPKDSDNIFYGSISKRVTLAAGNNTIQLQMRNEGPGTARIFEANCTITKT